MPTARPATSTRTAFTVDGDRPLDQPGDGRDLPGGLARGLPGEGLEIDLRPTVPQQELDTRATTGVVYWEGSQVVTATRDGRRWAARPTSS